MNTTMVVQKVALTSPAPLVTSIVTPEATPLDGKTLIFADIDENAARTIQGTQPFADYVVSQLASLGYTQAKIRVAHDFEELISWINNGEIDIYIDTPFPSIYVDSKTNFKPTMRVWRSETAEYFSIIFIPKDSPIQSIDELKGQVVAMDEPYSTSGYLLPAAYLAKQGLSLEIINKMGDPVRADQVGILFLHDDNNILDAVLSKKVAAGAVESPLFYKTLPAETRKQFKVLVETKKVPRLLLNIRADMDADLQRQLTSVLTSMADSQAGLAALRSYRKAVKVDQYPGDIQKLINAIMEDMRLLGVQ